METAPDLLYKMTQQLYKDVALPSHLSPQNITSPYEKRRLDPDGIWMGKAGIFKDKNFLECASKSTFVNPLEGKNHCKEMSVPKLDRIMILNKLIVPKTQPMQQTRQKPKGSPKKDYTLVGSKMDKNKMNVPLNKDID